jgi:hypothetical protein
MMMSHDIAEWYAITESGAKYVRYGGYVERWRDGSRVGVIRVWTCLTATVPDEELTVAPWGAESEVTQWERLTVPVVGRRMYFAGREEWRLSTAVVEFTILGGVDS